MICEKCGREIAPELGYCAFCAEAEKVEATEAKSGDMSGFYAAEEAVEGGAANAVSYGAEAADAPAPKRPGKKIGKTVLKVVAVCLAVVIALGAASFLIFPAKAKKVVARIFMSDESYFKYIEGFEAESTADALAERLLALSSRCFAGDMNASAVLTVDTDTLKNTLGVQNIDWLKKIALNYSSSADQGIAGTKLSLALGDESVATIDLKTDIENDEFYLRIPELCDKYAATDLGTVVTVISSVFDLYNTYDYGTDVEDDEYAIDDFDIDDYYYESDDSSQYGYYLDVINNILNNDQFKAAKEFLTLIPDLRDAVPDKDTTKRILEKYIRIILDDIEDVKKHTEKVSAGSSSKKYTAYTVKLNGNDLIRILKDVLAEAKSDEDILKIVDDMSQTVAKLESERGKKYSFTLDRDSFADSCESVAKAMSTYGPLLGGMFSIERTIYVNFFGDIKGLEFKINVGGASLFDVSVITIGDEKEYRVKMFADSVLDDDSYGAQIVVSGKTDGGRFNGTGALSEQTSGERHELLKLEVKDCDEERALCGEYNGKITIKAGDGLVDSLNASSGKKLGTTETMAIKNAVIDVDMNYSDLCQRADITLSALNFEIGRLALSFDTKEGDVDAALPDEYIEVTDLDSFGEWVGEWDEKSFCDRLGSAGLPDELCEAVREFFAAAEGMKVFFNGAADDALSQGDQ
ncbi:MAG: hypothetical protein IJQ80_02630 [Clostridia bacterium]|nr:hypothetical protein [Clostridia bacterium]